MGLLTLFYGKYCFIATLNLLWKAMLPYYFFPDTCTSKMRANEKLWESAGSSK